MSLRASRRPPTHPDAVVLACDKGHLPIALCVALRIVRLEPERRFDVAICTPDWDAIPAAWHDLPVRFVEIDVARLPAFDFGKSWISIGGLYRILLPDLLRPEYRRLLYLDTDTYLRRPGLQSLFDTKSDLVIAAALDRLHLKPARKLDRPKPRRLLDELGGSKRRFFQSGVLLMQTDPFVSAGLGTRMLDFVAQNADILARHGFGDQGAINAVASDLITPLSPLWNWSGRTWLRPQAVARFDPHILHFTGPNKPWLLQEDPFIASFAADYAACLAQHAPHLTTPTGPTGPTRPGWHYWGELLRARARYRVMDRLIETAEIA